jgi:hypothetical protein
LSSALALIPASLMTGGCGDTGLNNNNNDASGARDLAVADLSHPAPPPDFAQPPVIDLSVPLDLSYIPPTDANGIANCGDMSCGVGQVCCVSFAGGTFSASCASACGEGGVTATCDGPEDCGGNPCCAMTSGTTLNGVMCTSMPSDCPPSLGFGAGQTRACHVDGDCTYGLTNSQGPDCCSATQNGATVHFCFDKQFALGGITCP